MLCGHSHTNTQWVQKVTSNCSSINHAGLGFRHASEKCEGQGPRRDHLVPFGSLLGPSLPSVSFCLSPFIQMETNYLIKKQTACSRKWTAFFLFFFKKTKKQKKPEENDADAFL